ncbi:TetR/AcrR family transcriptional regulator [Antrihabitans cavernicola]|uniref:TetR/AcrR family transcriptional regulator n=1 Tax=Antrihabitans cavernicola TaxID=2495913 RepID=A0A5A7S4Z7_9NOCA|nr:TetR/AcrR family transcriptional regulator [Spelaeibacter cavernicola]KAA0021250.1 TetR/AcrR family transcriptional regulator [Spelaeibacter cavernicola]
MQVRDRLILAAEQQFADKGALDARLSDIRGEVGVSVGALYHHFPDKTALYHGVWDHALTDYQVAFWAAVRDHETAEGGIRAGVEAHLQWVTDHPARATILTGTRPKNSLHGDSDNRDFFRKVVTFWRTHAAYGSLRGLDFDIAYTLWLGPAQEYSRLWLAGAVEKPPSAVAPALADAAWRAVQRPRRRGGLR